MQYLGELGAEPVVHRNDELSADEAADQEPDAVLISPGPGRPEDAGVSCDIVRRFAGERPVLGVCLGHQCIGQVYGAEITNAPELMHGKTSTIEHDGSGVFADLPNPLEATRYHSLVIDETTVGPDLEVSARSRDGVVMGVRHRALPIEGVQFHPESILTTSGHDLLRNFLQSLS